MQHLMFNPSQSSGGSSASSSGVTVSNASASDFANGYNNPYDYGNWNWLTDLFDGNGQKRHQYDMQYNQYLADSQFQRMFKDLEAAGLNPYLIMQSGFGGSGNYAYQVDKNNSGNEILKNLILGIMMVARVAGSFMA